jgi:hypothetical protein
MRQSFAARFMARIGEDKDSLVTSLDMIATIDPPAAVQLDNTIKNIRDGLETFKMAKDLDPEAYVEVLKGHNELVDFTLSDLQSMAEKLARRSGYFQKRKVSAWFETRLAGTMEFNEGLKTQLRGLEDAQTRAGSAGKDIKALLQIFTDPLEWDKAKWAGTVFIFDPEGLKKQIPGLGVGFADFEAGKQIFEGWIKRVGHVDEFEEIRVSIIEGPLPDKPEGYAVMISSNPDHTIRRKQQTEPKFQPTNFVVASRTHRMKPAPGSQNLDRFKKAVADFGFVRLFPAHVANHQIQDTDMSLYVEKREIHFLKAADIRPNDPEYAVFARDEKQA